MPPCAVMSSTPLKNSTVTSVSRHMKQDVKCGLKEWGWSPESWPREGAVGWAWLNAKVRLSVRPWGVEREAGAAAKVNLS